MTLFDFNHWAHVIVLRVTAQCLLCFILNLRAISKYKPPRGVYLEGRFIGGFFALRVWGGEGLIFRILRHMAVINLPTNASLAMLNYC